MIPLGSYRDICSIYRRKATVKYGGAGADLYDLLAENVPCRFIEKDGRYEKQSDHDRHANFTAFMYLDWPVIESDEIELPTTETRYKIVKVIIIRDMITGLESYRRAFLDCVSVSSFDKYGKEPVINP